MVIQPTSLLAFPFFVVLWTLDAYVFVALLRLFLGRLHATRNTRLCVALQEVVDPIADHVDRRLVAWRQCSSPPWVPWVIVVGTAVILRHLFLWAVTGVLS